MGRVVGKASECAVADMSVAMSVASLDCSRRERLSGCWYGRPWSYSQ